MSLHSFRHLRCLPASLAVSLGLAAYMAAAQTPRTMPMTQAEVDRITDLTGTINVHLSRGRCSPEG